MKQFCKQMEINLTTCTLTLMRRIAVLPSGSWLIASTRRFWSRALDDGGILRISTDINRGEENMAHIPNNMNNNKTKLTMYKISFLIRMQQVIIITYLSENAQQWFRI